MGLAIDPAIAELAADATWPAELSVPLGPWRLRATHGYSHRANSVRTVHPNPSESATANWPALISHAEVFYRRHGLPTIFHISPATIPADLDQILAARGYAIEKPSQVWSADLAEVIRAAARPESIGQIVLRDAPDEAWLQCALDESVGPLEIRRQICRRIPTPRVFASVVDKTQTIATALAAVHSRIAWLYCVATIPAHQRRGHAMSLVHSLSQWSIANNAAAIYLQVMANNVPALALYARAAFVRRYEYHYRVLRSTTAFP
ncbi:MAG: GNAT family N-acetyltransferase [Tepidisphaeraceae bacterium]|jgi:ribosomal protein S18 acetylase RimI-like enzyme